MLNLKKSLDFLIDTGCRIEDSNGNCIKNIYAFEFSKSLRRNKERYEIFIEAKLKNPSQKSVFNFSSNKWSEAFIHDVINRQDRSYLGIYLPKRNIYLGYTLFDSINSAGFEEELKQKSQSFRLVKSFWMPEK